MSNLDSVAIALVICGTFIVGLVLTLRFLAAWRITDGEAAKLKALLSEAMAVRDQALNEVQKQVNNEREKLTQLSNRVR